MVSRSRVWSRRSVEIPCFVMATDTLVTSMFTCALRHPTHVTTKVVVCFPNTVFTIVSGTGSNQCAVGNLGNVGAMRDLLDHNAWWGSLAGNNVHCGRNYQKRCGYSVFARISSKRFSAHHRVRFGFFASGTTFRSISRRHYHKEGCMFLEQSKAKKSLKPCKRCFPQLCAPPPQSSG